MSEYNITINAGDREVFVSAKAVKMPISYQLGWSCSKLLSLNGDGFGCNFYLNSDGANGVAVYLFGPTESRNAVVSAYSGDKLESSRLLSEFLETFKAEEISEDWVEGALNYFRTLENGDIGKCFAREVVQ